MRLVLAAGLVLVGGQGMALTPPMPTCDTAGTAEAYLHPYEPLHLGNGFVSLTTTSGNADDTRLIIVLEYCPTRRQLVIGMDNYFGDNAGITAVEELYSSMIHGSAEYTMEQIAGAMSALGASTALHNTAEESCACATFAGQ